jgi:AbrB family looped-hinge helix DNA binding protein
MAAQQPVLEYLATTKIGEKGQLTVPKQFREDLGLATGAPFAVLRMGNGLLLIPEQERLERLCAEIGGALIAAGATPESLLESLPDVRKSLYEERYGPPTEKPRQPRASRQPPKSSLSTTAPRKKRLLAK